MPGDEVVIDVRATLDEGNSEVPASHARVSIGVIDESVLALSDQTDRPLEDLYGWVRSGVEGFYGSHENGNRDRMLVNDLKIGGVGFGAADMATEEAAAMETSTMSRDQSVNQSEGSDIAVRSIFEDTAVFATVTLDENGNGTYSFTLPHNVTQWRIMAAAVDEEINAGSNVASLNVSLPFFINTNMNRTYLTSDVPYIGMAAYGSELKEGEKISYRVYCPETGYEVTGDGVAFEKMNLPLFELSEGTYHIEVTAVSEQGHEDGYEEIIEVVDTYQVHKVMDTYDAQAGMNISGGETGMTTLTFADGSKAKYLPILYRLAYGGGKRVDQIYMSSLAREILNSRFELEFEESPTMLEDYMSSMGGITLLPYGEEDLMTTVKLAPYVEEEHLQRRIKAYLYSVLYEGDMVDRSAALYGLAVLGEPVLLEMNRQQQVDNLTFEDWLYLALAYDAVSDTYMAGVIFEEHLKGYAEVYETRVRFGYGEDPDSQYRLTSMMLPLLAVVDQDMAEKAYDYVSSNYSKVYLANLDLFAYAMKGLESAHDTEAALTYTYDGESYEVAFDNWYGRSITLPSVKLGSFEVTQVQSQVTLALSYDAAGARQGDKDSHVSVTRRYLDSNTGEEKTTFKPGDIVKVVIDWSVDDNAIDHSYTVTDYAPSGLVPVKGYYYHGDNSDLYWYRTVEDQKVQFGAYKKVHNYKPMVYYARVVSAGDFKGDPVMIQGNSVRDSYNLSESAYITIKQ